MVGCADDKGDINKLVGASAADATYPLLTPPVVAAAPAALRALAKQSKPTSRIFAANNGPQALQAGDIQSRFFQAGPSNVFFILAAVDKALDGINRQLSNTSAACQGATPTPYTMRPLGDTLQMYAQCYSGDTTGGTGFTQWATQDGNFYLYHSAGAAWVAATVHPLVQDGNVGAAPAPQNYLVDAYLGVGLNNAQSCPNGQAWDRCSYGVIHVKADPQRHAFEMVATGMGLGYCGAQLRSDGDNVYAAGSNDMGTVCADPATLCVKASDFTTAGSCDSMAFALPPAGRTQSARSFGDTWAASTYPGGSANTALFDGTQSDALHAGPDSPTPGVMPFQP